MIFREIKNNDVEGGERKEVFCHVRQFVIKITKTRSIYVKTKISNLLFLRKGPKIASNLNVH